LKTDKDVTASGTFNQTHLAVIGIGCLFPKADNLEAYWSNILNGVDAITEVPETHWQSQDYFGEDSKAIERLCSARGGFISPVDFNPIEFGIPPNAIEAIDTSQLLGLVITQQALKDSGYGPGRRNFDRDRVSVIMGVTGALELVIPLGARLGHPIWRKCLKEAGVEDAIVDDAVNRIASSYVPWQENSFPGLLGNVVAGRIAKHFDLGGTNCVIDAACASSLSALHLAGLELASGRSDMVVTGGVDTFNDVFMFTCFSETQALSPSGNARPFDAQADGTILGEGLGVVVVKRLKDAQRDKDRIYAVIRGIGTSSDGKGQAIYAPSPEGQVRALRNAYQNSDVTPDTIELVEAHGTGTKAGDMAELSALTEVYGSSQSEGTWCALGSVKSQIGHTKAAAGVAGIIKAAMALHHKVLPPTIKVNQPSKLLMSERTPFYVNTQKRPWLANENHPRRAAVSAFGFGGSNFHCVLEEYNPEKTEANWDEGIQILCFSTQNREALKTDLEKWPVDMPWQELRERAQESRSLYNHEHAFRIVLALERGRTDTAKTMANARTMLDKYPLKNSWSTPEGAYFGTGSSPGKLGVVFSGQGSQYVGMFRDLACRFPQMQQAIEEAGRSFTNSRAAKPGNHLIDYIYPHPVFTEEAEADNERALRATQIAQPAIGAVSFGALKVLEYFDVQPDAVAGHSYGELTALCASERMDTRGFFSLSMVRGRLMAEGNIDKGAMLAVKTSVDLVGEVIREEKLDLVIANKNAPDQMVLSGTTDEIKRAARAFDRIKVQNRLLPVSGAFHSSLVAHVREPFLAALGKVDIYETGIPVFANSTANEYPIDPDEVRSILADQLVNPVEFVKEIENMYRHGVRTFLEVGPGAKLTGLVKAIMKGREYSALSLDSSSGRHSGLFDLASSLAFLSVRGYDIKLTLWDPVQKNKAAQTDQKRPPMTIPICGANYMNQKSRNQDLTSAKYQASKAPSVKTALPENTISTDGPVSGQPTGKASVIPVMHTPANPEPLAEALRMTQENMAGLQKLQEQTNQLHRQFLEGQAQAQRTFQALVEQQHHLIQASLGKLPQAGEASFSLSAQQADPGPVQAQSYQVPAAEQNPEHSGIDHVSVSRPDAPEQLIQTPIQSPAFSHVEPSENTDILSNTDIESSLIEKTLLEIVAEKTGYPVEMLELDMELDSDLGIDSIKRVEILSDLQEKLPEAPVAKPEHLGSLKTLTQIVAFLSGPSDSPPSPDSLPAEESPGVQKDDLLRASDAKPSVRPHVPDKAAREKVRGQSPEGFSISNNEIERSVLSLIKLEETVAREGFSISKGSKIWITEDDTGLASGLKERLTSLNYAPKLVPFKDLENIERPEDLGGLVILSPSVNAGDAFLKDSFRLLKHAGPGLRNTAVNGGSVLMTISRMDGSFGFTSLNGQNDPASAGIAGLLKTARHEWPEVHCKALDLAGDYKDISEAVTAIVEEMFLIGPVEVGLSHNGRHTLQLSPVPIEKAFLLESPPLNEGDVVVITGGGRGVTAQVATALAGAFKPTLVLLGRSSKPEPEPDWLAPLTDEAEIKKQLLHRSNGNSSPKQIEEQYCAINAGRELVRNIAGIESAGARVIYRSVDVRDTAKIQSVLEEIRDEEGPIKGLIHGAGVIADCLIEEKTAEQFDQVYSTKVAGLRSLLRAMEQDDLKIMVLFSSFTGRYGRSGQIDYAAANEVLNKFAQQQDRLRPECRVVSVNWGPWNGGMVNTSLRKIFEQEGIGLINLKAGADYLVQEICSNGDRPVEVVIMGKKSGDRLQESIVSRAPSPLSVTFKRQLNVEDYPFLKSHVMNGRAVLPMAIIIEWMAHGAMHGNPGMKFAGFDNLRILKALTMEDHENCIIQILAGKALMNGSTRTVSVELTSSGGNGSNYVHARAEILLAKSLPKGNNPVTEIPLQPYPLKTDEIYDTKRLFHGPEFRGLERVEGYSEHGIVAIAKTAPLPSTWMKSPLRNTWLADPLILDSSFQMMVLWSLEKNGVGSLPSFAGHYRQFQPSYPSEGVRIVIRVTQHNDHKALADIDFIDPFKDKLIARMEGYECIIDASLNSAFRRNQLPRHNGVEAMA